MSPRSEPQQHFLGWHAQPTLLNRLQVHIIAGLIELAALVAQGCSALSTESHRSFFISSTVLPFCVISVKTCWAVRLGVAYLRFRGTDYASVVLHRSYVHSRSCWSSSAAAFGGMSWLLTMWYFLVAITLAASEPVAHKSSAAVRLLATASVFLITHSMMVLDMAMRSIELPCSDRTEMIYDMYRKLSQIRLSIYAELDWSKSAPGSEGQLLCPVCLEEFLPEDYVSELCCGHVFHPVCVHLWLLKDWRCPFRCSLPGPVMMTTVHDYELMAPMGAAM